jgi:hypothetical protein
MMTREETGSYFWEVVHTGWISVLLFDIVASLASRSSGIPYVYASVGSFLIYATIGYLVFSRRGLEAAVGAALLVELVDATLGWFISWQIGPGALSILLFTQPIVLVAIIVAILLFAVISAVIGASVARAINGRRA